jgi:hypothetical protein
MVDVNMADNSMVGGLFGVDPAQYQQQQALLQSNQNMQLAQLDPLQAARYSLMQGGTQLGNAGMQLLGIEDPQLQQAKELKQIAKQFDTTTPQGLIELAKAVQAKYPQQAQQAVEAAQKMMKTGAETMYKTKQAQAEGTGTEWIGVPGNPELKQQAIVDRINNTVTPIGAPISVFSNKQLINIDAKGESEFAKQLGKNDANTVTAAMTTRQNSVNAIKSLDKLASLDDQKLYSGSLAEERTAVGNLLDTLGLASKDDVKRISASQQYGKVAGDVVLQTLGGKLGAGFSNEDRKFIAGLVPQLGTNPEARKQLINYMRSKNAEIIQETSDLENYAREKKGLGGFKYKLPKETIAPIGTSTGDVPPNLLKEMQDRGFIPKQP